MVQLIVKWRRREQCRISILFALLAATRIDAPAVPDDEYNGASHSRARTLPMNEWMDKQFFVSVEF